MDVFNTVVVCIQVGVWIEQYARTIAEKDQDQNLFLSQVRHGRAEIHNTLHFYHDADGSGNSRCREAYGALTQEEGTVEKFVDCLLEIQKKLAPDSSYGESRKAYIGFLRRRRKASAASESDTVDEAARDFQFVNHSHAVEDQVGGHPGQTEHIITLRHTTVDSQNASAAYPLHLRRIFDGLDKQSEKYRQVVQSGWAASKDYQHYVSTQEKDLKQHDKVFWKTLHKLKWPMEKRRITDKLNMMTVLANEIKQLSTLVRDHLHLETWKYTAQLVSDQQQQKLTYFMDWLYPSKSFHESSNSILRHSEKSQPVWFLKRKDFRDWLNPEYGRSKWLMLTGIGGLGKTYLATWAQHEVELASTDNDAVVMHYCEHRNDETRTPPKIFGNFCAQLLHLIRRRSGDEEAVSVLRDADIDVEMDWTGLMSYRRVWECLVAHFNNVYCIVDALDECAKPEEVYLSLKEHIAHLSNLRLLATSRPQSWIMSRVPQSDHYHIHIDRSDEESMTAYIRSKEAEVRALAGRTGHAPDSLIARVQKSVLDCAGGIFLFAELQWTQLRDCESAEILERRLARPQLIDAGEQLEEAINRVKHARIKSNRKLGLRAIMWAVHSKRNLTYRELAQALSMYNRPVDADLYKGMEPSKDDIITATAHLISVQDQESRIDVHKVYQDYCNIPYNREEHFPMAEREIARICLSFLSMSDFLEGHTWSSGNYKKRLERYPFLEYAACHWGDHVRGATEKYFLGEDTEVNILEFLNDENLVATASQALLPSFRNRFLRPDDLSAPMEPNSDEPMLSGIHLAAYFGLDHIIARLLEDSLVDINKRSNDDYTPLHLACWMSQVSTVKLLLSRGADPSYAGIHQESCLHTAISNGSSKIVQLLLGSNRRILEKKNWQGNTPLCFALANGKHEIARLLITWGANVDTPNNAGGNALELAGCSNNSSDIVDTIIRFSKKLRDGKVLQTHGHKVLKYAVQHRLNNVVRCLVEHGVHPEAREGNTIREYETCYHIAATHSNKEAVGIMTAKCQKIAMDGTGPLSIDWESSQGNLQTPLNIAMDNDKLDLFEEFLRCGASTPPLGSEGVNTLHLACERGKIRFVEVLLNTKTSLVKGADMINKLSTTRKRSPLFYATRHKHCSVEMLNLLIGHGADPSMKDSEQRVPIANTAEHNNLKALCRLLEEDSVKTRLKQDENVANKHPPIQVAVCHRSYEAFMKLKEAGLSCLRAYTWQHHTLLHTAAWRADHKIAKELIPLFKAVGRLDCVQTYNRTALDNIVWASRDLERHYLDRMRTLELFLKAGAVGSPGLGADRYSTFHQAVAHSLPEIVEGMCRMSETIRGMINHPVGEMKITPLHAAVRDTDDKENIVRILLRYGADPGKFTARGRTPLHDICSPGKNVGVLRAMLDHGADPSTKDALGRNALYLATQFASEAFFDELLDRCDPALITVPDGRGETPLHRAAANSNAHRLRRLLEKLPRPELVNVRTPYGLTPQDMAYEVKRNIAAQNEKGVMHVFRDWAKETGANLEPVYDKYK